ncbi:acylphosphatase [Helicobacter mastomyrinus]|mgnify:CR=1 FL=1|uniref:Acylphosphatase n=2 Tax=Helicobacter TaxID=209 RepID=A0ABZ3F3W7_9HELI|nr:acylphosphatase [uncultured Helicobacter sp.]
MKICKQFLIFGRVQGVGFRRFVKAKVDIMNEEKECLSGYVRNLADGSVQVVAQGDEDILQKLEELLKVGTIKSVVERIESTTLEIDEILNGFEIVK